MIPFQVLYGYLPPHLDFPSTATTFVAVVEDYLKQRDVVIDLLKVTRHKSMERMKFFADQTITGRVFAVGDKVYLKLQPYRQTSVALRRNLKLPAKYYGPFTIVQRIGATAYKLQLPVESRIHPVFHVSQLNQHIGATHSPSPSLPVLMVLFWSFMQLSWTQQLSCAMVSLYLNCLLGGLMLPLKMLLT
ncbi:uncharacterized protein LOC113352431 [Papaver somniferum]|uniref:uncharacterized protein LOC113352431 n=1 Tax=Papaver somniferum TaxID=3469 RepID=UPI000E700D21|nr:uncharacterized protein LOC113352431 [Papaver somniferum]